MFAWPGARHRVRSGPDGADLELLRVIDDEDVPERFARVVIGSGDGIFAAPSARLRRDGLDVVVVSRREALSRELARTAADVRLLGEAAPGPLASRPRPE